MIPATSIIRRILRAGVCLVLASAIAAGVLPQDLSGQPTDSSLSIAIDHVSTEDFPTVRAHVRVLRGGQPVAGIGQHSFALFEDGEPVESVGLRNAESRDVPLSVVFVSDVSFSMRGSKLEELQKAQRAFVKELRETDQVALVTFEEQVVIASPLAPKSSGILSAINGLEASGRWTRLYDAIHEGLALATTAPRGQVAVVVMTDCQDNDSSRTPDGLVQEAIAAQIPVYVIAYGQLDRRYVRPMEALAAESAGRFIDAREVGSISTAYDLVSEYISGGYYLFYDVLNKAHQDNHRLLTCEVSHAGQTATTFRKFQVQPEDELRAANALLTRGKEHFENGEYEQAMEAFRSALALNAVNEEAAEWQKRTREQWDREQSAKQALEDSRALIGTGQYEAAIARAREGLVTYPTYEPLQTVLEEAEGKKAASEERADRKSRAERRIGEAREYVAERRYEQALAALAEARSLIPDNAEIPPLKARAESGLETMKKFSRVKEGIEGRHFDGLRKLLNEVQGEDPGIPGLEDAAAKLDEVDTAIEQAESDARTFIRDENLGSAIDALRAVVDVDLDRRQALEERLEQLEAMLLGASRRLGMVPESSVALSPADTRCPPAELALVRRDLRDLPEIRIQFRVFGEACNTTGLRTADFQLKEDDVLIEDFVIRERAGSGARTDILVLCDLSAGMEQESIAAFGTFVAELASRLRTPDRMAVRGVSDESRTVIDWSADHEEVRRGLPLLTRQSAGPNTALYDAVLDSIQSIGREDASSRAIIAFSDGQDLSSRNGPDAILQAAETHNVPLYVVGDGFSGEYFEGLGRLAQATGGAVFPVIEDQTPLSLYNHLSRDVTSTYELSYQARQPTDRKWHTVQLALDDTDDHLSLKIEFTGDADGDSGRDSVMPVVLDESQAFDLGSLTGSFFAPLIGAVIGLVFSLLIGAILRLQMQVSALLAFVVVLLGTITGSLGGVILWIINTAA